MKRLLLFFAGILMALAFVVCDNSNPSGSNTEDTDTSGVDTAGNDFLQYMKDYFSGDPVVDSSYGYLIQDTVIAVFSTEDPEEDTSFLSIQELSSEGLNLNALLPEDDTSEIVASESQIRIFNDLLLGDGESVEGSVWQMDSISADIAVDLSSMGADTVNFEKDTSLENGDLLYFNQENTKLYRVYMEGETLFELDSLFALDTASLLDMAMSTCPYALLSYAEENYGEVSPVSDIDTAASDCDTTYAYYKPSLLSTDPVEAYITDNGSGVVTVYSVADNDSIGELNSLVETFSQF
ncbi:MAG: hypothetical protein ACOCSE_00770 [Chitinivibrionales bacterium]